MGEETHWYMLLVQRSFQGQPDYDVLLFSRSAQEETLCSCRGVGFPDFTDASLASVSTIVLLNGLLLFFFN